jgi:arylsulfatase A-like enzyme
VQGQDLSHVLRGEPGQSVQEAAYLMAAYRWYNYPEWRGVRTERYTYAKTLQGPWLLYDNAADPYQMHNRAGDPAAAEIMAHLDTLTLEMTDRTWDRFVSWDILGEEVAHRRSQWLKTYGYAPPS